jgi:hypothetical protein
MATPTALSDQTGVLERTELKYFHYAGHEEDQAENEESPGAVCIVHDENVQRSTLDIQRQIEKRFTTIS